MTEQQPAQPLTAAERAELFRMLVYRHIHAGGQLVAFGDALALAERAGATPDLLAGLRLLRATAGDEYAHVTEQLGGVQH